MNSNSITVLSMAMLAVFAVVPCAVHAQSDPVDKAYQPPHQSRIWWVYKEPIDQPHLKRGDRFRIQRQGSTFQFVPSHALKTDWGFPSGAPPVDLLKTTGSPKRLCGELEIHDSEHPANPDNHTKHVIAIAYDDAADLVAIATETRDAAAFPDKLHQCDSLSIHGGVAHAEN